VFVTRSQYDTLVRKASETPTVEPAAVNYAAAISTGGRSDDSDTILLVSDETLCATSIDGKESESSLDFSLSLDDVDELRCEGLLAEAITVDAGDEAYSIPTDGLKRSEFTAAIVEHSHLSNPCEWMSLNQRGLSLCQYVTCFGCALIALGVGCTITVIGIFVGLPLIGLGIALLLAAFAYRGICNWRGLNVWKRAE
jgi:hypothetical protein